MTASPTTARCFFDSVDPACLSRRVGSRPDSDVRNRRNPCQGIDLAPVDHVSNVIDVVAARVEDDVSGHSLPPPTAEETADEAMRANSVVWVSTERDSRPEQKRTDVDVLLIEQLPVLHALDAHVPEGDEVVGELWATADDGQRVCGLTGSVTFDVQVVHVDVVDKDLSVLDVLRDALRGQVVLVEQENNPGTWDDAQLSGPFHK